ncbi:hypothetical protein QP027_03130 [Corynebacterium breve]|uniref:Uncharacterized protein n=1 Tax=Corynebacterium breve TaxID=3049799 RepID=A0ABY8VLH8_9CORY|nr:hypothetical protein [Corynebacterium breve]WIM68405.1 hypothetical protein QP027_03130 [Corynebacterium breve]
MRKVPETALVSLLLAIALVVGALGTSEWRRTVSFGAPLPGSEKLQTSTFFRSGFDLAAGPLWFALILLGLATLATTIGWRRIGAVTAISGPLPLARYLVSFHLPETNRLDGATHYPLWPATVAFALAVIAAALGIILLARALEMPRSE